MDLNSKRLIALKKLINLRKENYKITKRIPEVENYKSIENGKKSEETIPKINLKLSLEIISTQEIKIEEERNLKGNLLSNYIESDSFIKYINLLIKEGINIEKQISENNIFIYKLKIKDYQKFHEITKNINNQSDSKIKVNFEEIPKEIFKLIENIKNMPEISAECGIEDLGPYGEKLPKILKERLYPFQISSIKFAIERDGRVMIADDMGLGKTLQAIAIIAIYKDDRPGLIIAPKLLCLNWKREIENYLGMDDEIYMISNKEGIKDDFKIGIISYDYLKKHPDIFIKVNYKLVVLDESHYLKNPSSMRSKVIFPYIKKVKRLIMLSGTPTSVSPKELYIQLKAISPNFLKYKTFCDRYCEKIDPLDNKLKNFKFYFKNGKKIYSKYGNKAIREEELRFILKNYFLIRRLKKDVLKLPKKMRKKVILDVNLNEYQEEILKSNKMIRTITCNVKIKPVIFYLQAHLEISLEKIVIFAIHHKMLDSIENLVKLMNIKYIRVDGRISGNLKDSLCVKFHEDPDIKIAILSIKAAGVGITLTEAAWVIFTELPWTPADLAQAEDRVYRLGQDRGVLIEYLIAKGTYDEKLWNLLESKVTTLKNIGLNSE